MGYLSLLVLPTAALSTAPRAPMLAFVQADVLDASGDYYGALRLLDPFARGDDCRPYLANQHSDLSVNIDRYDETTAAQHQRILAALDRSRRGFWPPGFSHLEQLLTIRRIVRTFGQLQRTQSNDQTSPI